MDENSFNNLSQAFSIAEDQTIFMSDDSNFNEDDFHFTLNQQFASKATQTSFLNPPDIYFEIEDFFSDFIFFIDNIFSKQQFKIKETIIFHNGFTDLTGLIHLFKTQSFGDIENF